MAINCPFIGGSYQMEYIRSPGRTQCIGSSSSFIRIDGDTLIVSLCSEAGSSSYRKNS